MIENYKHIAKVKSIFEDHYGFMSSVIDRSFSQFGDKWAESFESTLANNFDERGLTHAVKGYVEFAIDALRLQSKFDAEGAYVNKSYEEAAVEVYHNKEYMFSLYLPGILMSHYLWPHHYRQNEFFREVFLPEMSRSRERSFADIGVGSGYYSRMILELLPDWSGCGFDISNNSMEYTLQHIENYGFKSRYLFQLRNIVEDTPIDVTNWLISVEVLEHLEDPLTFLRSLRKMLRLGGKGFITAALNAPNADHIYLYRNPLEVIKHLNDAGFNVEQYHSSFAFPPKKPGLPPPEISAFIVS